MKEIIQFNPSEEEEKIKEEKPDMTDFETFVDNFDKIEKQHRKAGKNMVKGVCLIKFIIIILNLNDSGSGREKVFKTSGRFR